MAARRSSFLVGCVHTHQMLHQRVGVSNLSSSPSMTCRFALPLPQKRMTMSSFVRFEARNSTRRLNLVSSDAIGSLSLALAPCLAALGGGQLA
eukprot:2550463-Pyramimonas_sp.AAC.1